MHSQCHRIANRYMQVLKKSVKYVDGSKAAACRRYAADMSHTVTQPCLAPDEHPSEFACRHSRK